MPTNSNSSRSRSASASHGGGGWGGDHRRQAAMAKLKAAKQGLGAGGGALYDDELDPSTRTDNDDIFEYVDENEYKRIVESRRQREDFVVDDDGLGYYDDGEERFGEEALEHDDHGKKRTLASSAVGTANLTVKALKKIRQNAAAATAAIKTDPEEEQDGRLKNRSMWDFVNRGNVIQGSAAAATTGGDMAMTTTTTAAAAPIATNSSSSLHGRKRPTYISQNVDALLEQLDDPFILSHRSTRDTRRHVVNPRRGGIGGSYNSRSHGRRARSQLIGRAQHQGGRPNVQFTDNHRSATELEEDQMETCNSDVAMMTTWDNDEGNENFNDDNNNIIPEDSSGLDTQPTTGVNDHQKTKKVHFLDYGTTVDGKEGSIKPSPVEMDIVGSSNNQNGGDAELVPSLKPRRRRLGMVSEPARKAQELELARSKPEVALPLPAPAPLGALDTNIPTFLPDPIPDEADSTTMATTAGQIPLDSVLQKDSEERGDYIDMFWMDLCERNGDIMLFGKVPNQQGHFISACAIVTGNVRNLYVLPRRKDGVSESITSVHAEINELLQKSVLPRQAGSTWAGKPVQRQYAFDDRSIPREKTEYLKVVYNAKYPVPDAETCQNGGISFARILGAGASIKETFIVKRKLMGPCWVRIRNPIPVKSALSWCKVEFAVDSPKRLCRWDLDPTNQNLPPPIPPPVVAVSIKLRTVVDLKTHKSQIVAVSALCHKHVMLQTSSDESPKHMTHFTIIRPLDTGTSTVPIFPRDMDREVAATMPQLKCETHERTLLSRLLTQIGAWDPDVLVGHNAWGYDMEILLQRCVELNMPTVWSKLGRRRRNQLPPKGQLSSRKEFVIADAISGRLLCDTYLSAKELLHETTYSLTHLAATVLKTNRVEIQPVDIPQWYQSSKSIVQLALSTLVDAQLVLRLMFKLQVLPLTTQLTCIAGNFWSHTLKSNRAERTEYLLLHEFHRLKYLPPEKKRPGKRVAADGKAKYSGGLVLEPKKGLYDSYVLLLDFNSLYPSIILEYNLCFTTLEWSRYQGSSNVEEEVNPNDEATASSLPPIPDESIPTGVLPKVIKSLVERRKAVKNLLKNESNVDKKQELDIRQKALKLTANSMYGCLGFSNSRFYAQPIAALVTSKGRETLQNAVNIAQNKLGLEVIYGDTDSIMINTRLSEESDLAKVRKLGENVKREVNALYRTLELEVDGIFRSMLLLKKKKYAARTVEELPNGEIRYGRELKGLDLVRRDWCVQSKDTGRWVTDQILSGQDSEEIRMAIFNHLEELAARMRNQELPLEKYVITKGLSKHPNDYPDGKSTPHVQVAKMMLQNARPVNVGDHIPYVVTEAQETEASDQPSKNLSSAERARHPEEIVRSKGALKPDIEWYLTQQILPPVARLCEPIEGMSQNLLAEKLGLDGSRYNFRNQSGLDLDADIAIDYTPASSLPDKERFKNVQKLSILCNACGVESEFPGVFQVDAKPSHPLSGLCCANMECPRPDFWGEKNHFQCYAKIVNNVLFWTRGLMTRYYAGVCRCDEPGCGLETNQLSVLGGVCLRLGCNGRMYCVVTEHEVYTHLKYLGSLFDTGHACEQLARLRASDTKDDPLKNLSKRDLEAFKDLHHVAKSFLEQSAYNFIPPSFWAGLPTAALKQ